MPTLAALFFASIVALATVLNLPTQEAMFTQAVADVAATSALAYRESVINYLNTNPGFSGTVPDASITALWGYQRDARWTNTVVSGSLYIYESTPSSNKNLMDILYIKTKKSYMVGRNQSGLLVSSKGFGTGITVPIAVPVGAIMIFGK
jgi:PilM